jgi:hypothetical protein
VFDFWFRAAPVTTGTPSTDPETIFVDKSHVTTALDRGTLANPYNTISAALAVAGPGDIVRILGNPGLDGDIDTWHDNHAYLIGYDNNNNPLPDGTNLAVPRGVTVMVDADALLKLRLGAIDVGSSSTAADRSEAALQVLGIPGRPVYFRSFRDDAFGGDTDPNDNNIGPRPSDWAGIIFRDDSDREAKGIFLNWISGAEIRHGGGRAFIDGVQRDFAPLHLVTARPAIVYNTITENSAQAISANPNSFSDQIPGNTDPRLSRIGPHIRGNLVVDNKVNGLFIRIPTQFGSPLERLDVTARFDDTDIVHVIKENLVIAGAPGGPLGNEARTSGRLAIDPGIVVKLGLARIEGERGSSHLIAEGTKDRQIVFTSVNDDRYGMGGTFDTSNDGPTAGSPGDWGGLVFHAVSRASIDNALITFGGGEAPIEAGFANFNAVEAHQARLRLTNSILERNASGLDTSDRNGRLNNAAATVFVRGAHPVIVNNVIQNNPGGAAISVNVNALGYQVVGDYGRSTGASEAFEQFSDNRGPLIRLNRLDNNAVNGLSIRAAELTTEGVWDDTDIVHVLTGEVLIRNQHTYGGLRLQSSNSETLVVKLSGPQAGFTVNGRPLDIEDRIGGSLHIVGSVGHPVVLTSLNDCTVGAGLTPDGRPQTETIPGSVCSTDVVEMASYADVIVVIDESSTMRPYQDFTEEMIPQLEASLVAGGIGDGTTGINQYGLVGYGGGGQHSAPHAHPVGPGGALWGNAVEYVAAAQTLVTVAGVADGYWGIDYALDNYAFRPDAAKFIILVTDTYREGSVATRSPATFSSLLAKLNADDITLQTIVNARFRDGSGNSAIAVDSAGTAYLADGAGGYTSSSGGYVASAAGDIRAAYIDLGWATGGISGDLQPISVGGNDSLSFSRAFTDSIVSQVSGSNLSAAGDWRGILLDQWSNDRNVAIILEQEPALTAGGGTNDVTDHNALNLLDKAEVLGILARDEKSGDETRRLGFEVHGRISDDRPTDVDVYSFEASGGTEIWVDLDRTAGSLDSRVEILDVTGTVIAGSKGPNHPADFWTTTGFPLPDPLTKNAMIGGDYYTLNPKDAGFHMTLPGSSSEQSKYFVRVSSDGATSGEYQLQIRLRQTDEKPGSTIRYADIRYATTAIDVRGLPYRSPLLANTRETSGNNSLGSAQYVGNLLISDQNVIGFGGELASASQIDWYRMTVQYDDTTLHTSPTQAPKVTQWSTVFDVDYADGLTRPDSTLAVFKADGTLAYIGRESNIEDDLAGQPPQFDDLSRGSVGDGNRGTRDPFIGPVLLLTNTDYNLAMMSNGQLPNLLSHYYRASGFPTNAHLTRLEPINSINRIVEDHIGFTGYATNGPRNEPVPRTGASPRVEPTTAGAILPIATAAQLSTHVKEWTFSDVQLYVSTENNLWSLNPYSGGQAVNVGGVTLDGGADRYIRDIDFRTDGNLYGYRNADATPTTNDVADVAGRLVRLDPGNAAMSGSVNDGIRGPVNTAVAATPVFQRGGRWHSDVTYTDGVEAMAWFRKGFTTFPTYNVYYSVTDPLAVAGSGALSKLYVDDQGDAQPDGQMPTSGERGYAGFIGGWERGYHIRTLNSANIIFMPHLAGTAGNSVTLTVNKDDTTNSGNMFSTVTTGASSILVTVYQKDAAGNDRTVSADQLVNHINGSQAARNIGLVYVQSNGGNNIVGALGGTTVWSPGSDVGGINGVVNGLTTGLAQRGDHLYGVTDRGEFFRFTNRATGATTTPVTVLHPDFGTSLNFQGLALGPQNVHGGGLANQLFAIDSSGRLWALTVTGNTPSATLATTFVGGDGNTRDIFVGGASFVATGRSGATGLTFSPLDFNLWHPTMQDGNAAGHGINPAPDNTRTPDEVRPTPRINGRETTEAVGGASFYFGLEQWVENDVIDQYFRYGPNAQYGVRTSDFQRDLTSNSTIGNNYNLPGGAQGSLITGSFSLDGYAAADKPTLYFNYRLDTEVKNSVFDSNDLTLMDQMRDSARVFISRNYDPANPQAATWELVATNNSLLQTADMRTRGVQAELPYFLSHSATAAESSAVSIPNTRQQVQELFETNNWRQARVDLSEYADQGSLTLRFDFSTSGKMNDPTVDFDYIRGNYTDRERGQNNQRVGFYIDDIIVGFSERGEMVTGVPSTNTTMYTVPSNPNPALPPTPPPTLAGLYQVEVRRGVNYGQLLTREDPNDNQNKKLQIRTVNDLVHDTNDRFIETTDSLNVSAGDNYTWPAAPRGDANVLRAQGQLVLESNMITNSSQFGIRVSAGQREAGIPHAGSIINFPNPLNTNRWVPGVVIQNNIVAFGGSGAISLAGDTGTSPAAAVPIARIVNNTLHGGQRVGTGIAVGAGTSPTILNNIVSGFATGIQNNGSGTVVGATFYQNNNNNGNLLGGNAIFAGAEAPLFLDPSRRNFYLQSGSQAIDSSLDALQDRTAYVQVKTPLGIPESAVFAPDYDVYGQLRAAHTVGNPGGGGQSIFKDRGAVDRVDVAGPYARIIEPPDNDAQDFDPNATVVYRQTGVLDRFTILLADGLGAPRPNEGTGVDGSTVSRFSVSVTQNGLPLEESRDYRLGYNTASNSLLLTPLSGLWETDSVYQIRLDNVIIADNAGNKLRANQPDGTTLFTIILGDVDLDYGDAPDSYKTLLTSNGARHVLLPDMPYLGATVEPNTDGSPSSGAADHADDDGVVFNYLTPTGFVHPGKFNVNNRATPITVTVGSAGWLDGWVDFNNNNAFDTIERLYFYDSEAAAAAGGHVAGQSKWLEAGEHSLWVVTPSWTVGPSGAGVKERDGYARFRIRPDATGFSPSAPFSPTGLGAGRRSRGLRGEDRPRPPAGRGERQLLDS